MILEKVGSNEWKSIKPSHGRQTISHLFFADDLLLFVEELEAQEHLMKSVVQVFCGISGERVNIGNSKLYISGNTNRAIELAISSQWGIPLTSDLSKYLRCPIIHARINKHTYHGVVIKVKQKLAS